MKVYLVCPECDDYYYGYSEPVAAFDSLEKAETYAEEHYKYSMLDDIPAEVHARVSVLEIQ